METRYSFFGMGLTRLVPLLVMAAGVAVALSGRTAAQSPEPLDAARGTRVDFARDVQPLLRANCYGCHSASLASGNFRLDRRRDSMPNRVGANGARIVAGNGETSRLYQRISGTVSSRMARISSFPRRRPIGPRSL